MGGARGIGILVGTLLVLSGPRPTEAQEASAGAGGREARGVLHGVVLHDGRPVAAAALTLSPVRGTSGDGPVQGATDDRGTFSFRIAAGEWRVVVRSPGFHPRDTTVRVPPGVIVDLRLQLVARVVTLAELQVTATPLARDPLRVPQSTTALSSAALDRERGSTLGATLAMQPGIAARWDGPAASAPVIRGLSGERIVILQDGQRTGDLAATAPDHAVTIDPAGANRIEIVRGPAALLYGSNAVGGVVNVFTGDLPAELPSSVNGSVDAVLEGGAPGGAVNAELSAPVGERGGVRFRAGYRSHADVGLGRGMPPAERDAWGGGARLPNTHFDAVNGALSGTWRIPVASLSATARTYAFDYGLPHAAEADPIEIVGRRDELLARLQVHRGSFAGARLEAGVQRYHHDERDPAGAALTALAVRSGSLQAVSPVALGTFADGATGVSLIWRDNDVIGDAALTPPNHGTSAGIFLYQELAAGRPVSFPIGVRLDHHRIRSQEAAGFGSGRQRQFTAISGSAGISLLIGSGMSLGASLARAVRAPTAEELFARAGHAGTGAFEMGDPELGTERALGGEVVLRVRGDRRRAQGAVYINRISGYIALYPTGRDTLVSDGGGERAYPLHVVAQRDATLMGAEGSAEWELRGGVILGVLADAVRGRDRDDQPLPYLPSARAGGSFRLERRNWSIGTRVRHALRQGPVPAGELRAGAHTLVDAHASLRYQLAGRSHEVTLRADNAFDVAYRDAASRVKEFAPSPGRNIVLGYRVIF